jgi:ketosteroid isomerase-like protein
MTAPAAPPAAARAPRSRAARRLALVAAALALAACAAAPPRPDGAELKRQVTETERAFAKTMADRDHAAFVAFLADDAVFFGGPVPLRGKQEVAAAWQRFYAKPDAPFSWTPGEVEVLASGTLALSTGPVRDATGKLVATYTSIWRLEAPGVWRIVFDKGNDACDCARAP